MRRDPFQLENLATDPAQEETVRRYQRRLDRMRGCSGVGCR